MNLEMFKYIDDIIDLYESKRDMYKLIMEEIVTFFEDSVFSESRYTLNMTSRLKSADSIREKLLRNNYISKYRDVDTILENFQDLIGLRIECKFIDDEKYAYSLLKEVFSETEDGIYYHTNTYPRIKLKLSDAQPQKQKNGFDIYKIDGYYLLGKDPIRFELQIMALVNSFWGDIEHKIIYKNNTYQLSDKYVTDLMNSIKKSLSMIDDQLYMLYSEFRKFTQFQEELPKNNSVLQIERFISKMVYDVFSKLMNEQVGFTMDFRASCDSVVKYYLSKKNAEDIEDYSRAMMDMFNVLNGIEERGLRVDSQFTFGAPCPFSDEFSQNLYHIVLDMVNSNYKWHLFFLMLFSLEWEDSDILLHDFISYYKDCLLKNRTLVALEGFPEANEIREDILAAVSRHFLDSPKIEIFSDHGLVSIHRCITKSCEHLCEALTAGKVWKEMRGYCMRAIAKNIEF